jgi:glycosyltransferase involved in cell wall biosynthesis
MISNKLPSITFAIPTLNEEKRIERALLAILNQDYPKEKIEIIIMDGGSHDKTLKICQKYTNRIYQNKKKLAEPGLSQAYKKANGDYMVFMAADNIFFDRKWLRKMIAPLLYDINIYASFSKVLNDPSDNIWNKFINEDAEPFSSFVFWNASHPDKFPSKYKTIFENINYVVYDYSPKEFPLIALAQGTMLKTKLKRDRGSKSDDILPLIKIIEDGKQIAFVKNTGLYHYSVKDFSDFRKKIKNRIFNSIKTNSFKSRDKYVSTSRRFRRYLFIVFTLLIVPSFFYSIYLAIRKRKIYMLLYFPSSLIICFYIIYNYLIIKLWQN